MGELTAESGIPSSPTIPIEPEFHYPSHHRSPTTASSLFSPSPDSFVRHHAVSAFSLSSDSDYTIGQSDTRGPSPLGQGRLQGRSTKPRWYKNVKSWLSVSEPSARALKSQRSTTFERCGIDPRDPQAAAKMHCPIGKIPEGVTTSTAGPSPERALRERARRATEGQRMSSPGSSQVIPTVGRSKSSNKATKRTAARYD